MTLVKELESVLNKYSAENESNTPDFILAKYLKDCLFAFDRAVVTRAQWYGRMDAPGQGVKAVKLEKTKFCPGCGSPDQLVIMRSDMERGGPCDHPWHTA